MTVTDARTRRHAVPALRQVRQRSRALPWPLALLTLSLFVPEQFYVDVGSFRLTAYRVVLFLVLPSIVARLLGGGLRLKAYDLAICLLGAWMIVAMSVNHGIEQGLESGGILAFEAIAAYLAARLCLTNRGEVVSFVRFLLFCLCLAAVVLLIEIAAGRRLVHELSYLLSGNTAGVGIGAHARFGLVRVSGPFAHPIHAGVFMTVILSFAWLTAGQPTQKLFQTGLLATGTLATLSSAPLIGGLLQAGLIAYHQICRRMGIRRAWALFFLLLGALMLFLEFASNRGAFKFLATSLALDPQTAYYRLLIWTYGVENVLASPVFGIGWSDWSRASWMGSTVDAFWLLIAMLFGLPAVALLGFAAIDIFRRIVQARGMLDETGRSYALALLISLFALIVVGFTVHYWGATHILFFIMLGLGGSFAAGAFGPERAPATDQRPKVKNTLATPVSQPSRDSL